MKKIFTLILLLSSIIGFAQSTTLVISQIYGAGGNTGAVYDADYVELKNISTIPQSLNGLSVQYGSSAVAAAWTGVFALPNVSIPAGKYYLIRMSTVGTNGISFTYDATTATGTEIAMSASSGRVALVNGTTALNACPTTSAYIDFIGYGTSTCFEGSAAAPLLTATTAAFRNSNGCTDTNNNGSDFTAAAPLPRNLSTAASICGTTSPLLSASTLTAFGNSCTNTTTTANSFTITGTNLTTANITVAALAGYTYSTTAAGTYTNTLNLTQSGASYSQQIFVKFTPIAVQSYGGNIVVSGAGASAINVVASGVGVNTIATVTVGAATGTNATSTTVSGAISSIGCSAVTAYGIEYSTINNFANGTGTPVASSNLAGGNFSSSLTGLAGSTTYYVHSYATNAGGTAYSAQIMFTTLTPTTPVLSGNSLAIFGSICVNTVSSVNPFTITGSNLTNDNISVAALAGFSYSTTAAGTYTSTLTLTQPGGNFSQQIFVKFIPTAIQSYNGNIVINGGGAPSINVGAVASGVNSVANVNTGIASATTTNAATLAGSIVSIGCSATSTYGFEYSTTNNFPNGTGSSVVSTNINAGSYTFNLTGLTVATTYYYRAFATNSGGTAYGSLLSFTTLGGTIASTTLADFGSVCINNTSAVGSFTLTSGNLGTGNINIAALNGFSYATTSTGTFSSSLSLPQPGGAYSQQIFVKFAPTFVQNYNGNIVVSGGGASTINIVAMGSGTSSSLSVTTDSATNIFKNTATLAGVIGGVSCTAAIAGGIEYSGISGFTSGTGTQILSNSINTGIFKVNVKGLVPNTKYYYRAFTVNGSGKIYGVEKSFTTAALGKGLIIYNNPVAKGGYLYYSIDFALPASYTVNIIDMLGRRVLVLPQINPISFIDDNIYLPNTLATGVYSFVLINTNNETILSKKFIIR